MRLALVWVLRGLAVILLIVGALDVRDALDRSTRRAKEELTISAEQGRHVGAHIAEATFRAAVLLALAEMLQLCALSEARSGGSRPTN